MRIAVVLVALPLTACAGAYHTLSDGRLQSRINDAYKARDACLARHAAAEGTTSVDTAALASAAALACTPETDALIEVMNRDGDPKVVARIQKDSEFRAMGFVMRARGQTAN
ncbi:MAG: hypothetical protein ISP49_09840 [Reyranella sp.]|jgi:hypothetical protein|nr:hypothetical protein [Reyranella sp.]MBL6651882.1 hypothetical protein [Reyranella sp.]